MDVIVRGFDEEIAAMVKEKAETALERGLQAFELWARIAEIKAELSIENGNLIITRKES